MLVYDNSGVLFNWCICCLCYSDVAFFCHFRKFALKTIDKIDSIVFSHVETIWSLVEVLFYVLTSSAAQVGSRIGITWIIPWHLSINFDLRLTLNPRHLITTLITSWPNLSYIGVYDRLGVISIVKFIIWFAYHTIDSDQCIVIIFLAWFMTMFDLSF